MSEKTTVPKLVAIRNKLGVKPSMREKSAKAPFIKSDHFVQFLWFFDISLILVCLIMLPAPIRAIRVIGGQGEASMNWPSTKGKPKWFIDRGRKVDNHPSPFSTKLSCTYTYDVSGKSYKNIEMYLGLYKIPADDVGGYDRADLKSLGEAGAVGKNLEDKDGLVTVYYDPNDPACSALFQGTNNTHYNCLVWSVVTTFFLAGLLAFLIVNGKRRRLWALDPSSHNESGPSRAKRKLLEEKRRRNERRRKERRRKASDVLTTDCPHCSQELEVSSDCLGQVVECPYCHEQLSLPAG
jgi:hypothetical protein